ncbi:MAG: hypothetical protein NTV23_10985 [Propionibacteriales bacterium]|nr:hypothetical protein [Propionibacteriales bacterium]
MTPRAAHTPGEPVPVPTAATRLRVAGWRDPRLLAGVLVVALSVVAGSVLLARADDATVVWGVRRAVLPGTPLAATDLESRRVSMDADDLDRYLRAATEDPVGRIVQREVGAGELVPAAALAAAGETPGVRVPLAVGELDLPPTVRVGSVVDVWVVSDADRAPGARAAERAFAGVRVVALGGEQDSLGPQTSRAVVVDVPGTQQAAELGGLIGRTAGGRVILTQSHGDALR